MRFTAVQTAAGYADRLDQILPDCPDRLCVQQHAICKERETIVCLPNKVVVEVVGGEEADLDSVTGKEMR